MNEIINIILALLAGLGLGILFFGGLWLTVKKLVTAKKPALLFAASSFFRTAIILVGFYFVSKDDWKRLIVCLLGFIIARFIILRLTKTTKQKSIQLDENRT